MLLKALISQEITLLSFVCYKQVARVLMQIEDIFVYIGTVCTMEYSTYSDLVQIRVNNLKLFFIRNNFCWIVNERLMQNS